MYAFRLDTVSRYPLARALALRALALLLWGHRVECPICGGQFRRFLAFGDRSGAVCPRCGSFERHRLTWLYLRARTDVFTAPHCLLHIAPEPATARRLARMSNLSYLSADLNSPVAMVRMDITDIPKPEGSFDVILCSHVLDDVSDDRAAMRELRRVLRPGGFAILQSPVDRNLAHTVEEEDFGQESLRRYGRDYADRLAEAGFDVIVDHFVQELELEKVARHGLNPEEVVYLCRKPE
jgi:SAM-dependent methyltransferase